MKLILKKVYDLSTSTRVELGIKLSQKCVPSVHFALKNARNIEIPLTLDSFDKIWNKRDVIRKFLETGSKEKEIPLNSVTVLCFIEFNNQRGLSVRGEHFHVSFLKQAAYQLLALRNSIILSYMQLSTELDNIPSKVEKLIKIISCILKNHHTPLTVEDLLQSDKINKTSIVENELLAYYFEEVYKVYQEK